MNNFSYSIVSLLLLVVAVSFLFIINCQADLCPDQKQTCRKGQTCCKIDKQGGYDCCPYENATCCTDGVHCCPEETECDVSAGRCRRRSGQHIRQSTLIPAFVLNTVDYGIGNDLEADVTLSNTYLWIQDKKQCPDKQISCPSTYTCCADPEGSYSCCPFTNATCCSDQIHCCPQGKKCKNSRCE